MFDSTLRSWRVVSHRFKDSISTVKGGCSTYIYIYIYIYIERERERDILLLHHRERERERWRDRYRDVSTHALLPWDYKRGGEYKTDTQLMYRHPTTKQTTSCQADNELSNRQPTTKQTSNDSTSNIQEQIWNLWAHTLDCKSKCGIINPNVEFIDPDMIITNTNAGLFIYYPCRSEGFPLTSYVFLGAMEMGLETF